MMGFFRQLDGMIRLRYVSADIGSVLAVLEHRKIEIMNVCARDELTLEFSVRRTDLNGIKVLTAQRGEQYEIIRKTGLFWLLKSLLKRPLLLAGLLICLITGTILPTRIFFISAEGNSQIPERQILQAAEMAGLKFGCSRRALRSEQIKNQLMETVPMLKWAGVNSYGSRAVITVRERADAAEEAVQSPVRHIIAARDGIVTSCTVTAGCGVCSVGQAVEEGDILISGYTDCGITIRADAAQGRIMAETKRDLAVLTPGNQEIRVRSIKQQTRFALILGKNRINFYKGSGISGASCVKMSTEYVLRLPGGFELPAILVKEVISEWKLTQITADDPARMLISFAETYLHTQMVSGSVLNKDETVSELDGVWILNGQYACMENIGVAQDEKIGDLHGKTDGTDRQRGSGG